MSKKSNSKEKKVIIKTIFSIPLDELAMYIFKRKEKDSQLFDLLDNNPEVVNIKIKKIIKEVLHKKKAVVKLKEVKFDYNDTEDFIMGIAYFNVKLKGTEKELRKVTKENKLFYFDWERNIETIYSA